MANTLNVLQLDQDVDMTPTDSLGGFTPFDSGVLELTVAIAYLDNAAKTKATSFNVVFKTADNRELRITEYVTSGEAKGFKPYFVDKRSNKKRPLPGYAKMDDLCHILTQKSLSEQDIKEGMVNIYDGSIGQEVAQSRNVLPNLTGKKVKAGVMLILDDKREENEKGDYVPTGEHRSYNEVDKFFYADTGLTSAEINAGLTEAKFIYTWLDKNEGTVKDKTDKTPQAGVKSGMPAGAQAANSTSSLFTPKANA